MSIRNQLIIRNWTAKLKIMYMNWRDIFTCFIQTSTIKITVGLGINFINLFCCSVTIYDFIVSPPCTWAYSIPFFVLWSPFFCYFETRFAQYRSFTLVSVLKNLSLFLSVLVPENKGSNRQPNQAATEMSIWSLVSPQQLQHSRYRVASCSVGQFRYMLLFSATQREFCSHTSQSRRHVSTHMCHLQALNYLNASVNFELRNAHLRHIIWSIAVSKREVCHFHYASWGYHNNELSRGNVMSWQSFVSL
jgi:hypothetical protein